MKDLAELYVKKSDLSHIRNSAIELRRWDLTPRQICDLELLMNGAFSPLKGFLTKIDYENVLNHMRLSDGSLWPIPIILDVTEDFAKSISIGKSITLCNQEGVILAKMIISDLWVPDKQLEAQEVYGSIDVSHPGVDYLFNSTGAIYLGGEIQGLEAPNHYDFKERRNSPNELRSYFRKLGWEKIVAFQTRNPLHRAHQELTFQAAKDVQANLLLHPVIGLTKPGDIDHFTRVRCYEAVLKHYPKSTTSLSLLNSAMRMAGPREAIWHGLIRKNYG